MLLGNKLYFTYGHIGYSYALHAGWNFTKFGGAYVDQGGIFVREVEAFKAIEGSDMTLVITSCLLITCILTIHYKNKLTGGINS